LKKKIKRPAIPGFRDDAEREEWSEKMLKNTDIVRVIRNWTHDKFYFKDRWCRFFFVNRGHEYKLRTKKTVHVRLGTTDFDIFSTEHAMQAWKDERRIMKTGKPLIGKIEKETWLNGDVTWVLTSKFPLRDRTGRVIGTWGVSRDMTALKKAEEELLHLNTSLQEANAKLALLSRTDALTGLSNIRHLYDILDRSFRLLRRGRDKGVRAEFSVILFDIDKFKVINDTWGHPAGDAVIRHVAEILKSAVRSTDFAFRYGGDEFLLLLPGTNLAGARTLAKKLLSAIRKTPCKFGGRKIPFTSSAGVSGSEEASDIEPLLKRVDKRLYFSKNLGRDRVS
jgi:diguanylate cyclase (GGDEF)-like protein